MHRNAHIHFCTRFTATARAAKRVALQWSGKMHNKRFALSASVFPLSHGIKKSTLLAKEGMNESRTVAVCLQCVVEMEALSMKSGWRDANGVDKNGDDFGGIIDKATYPSHISFSHPSLSGRKFRAPVTGVTVTI